MTIQNSYFMVSSRNLAIPVQKNILSDIGVRMTPTIEQASNYILYATSNIVKQPLTTEYNVGGQTSTSPSAVSPVVSSGPTTGGSIGGMGGMGGMGGGAPTGGGGGGGY